MPILAPPGGRDTLLTLTQLNLGADSPITDIIEENIVFAPEAQLFEADTIMGTSYPALVRTGFGAVQFRAYNQGVAPSTETYRTVEVQTSLIDARVECDRAYADSYHKGGAAGWQTLMANAKMESIMRLIGSQTYYGLAGDPLGFPGFWELVDPSMLTQQGGAVQGDNFRSSVWAVKTGPLDVKHVYGNGKTLNLKNEDWRIADIIPDSTQPTKKMEGYVNHWGGRMGLQVLSKNSIAGIAGITSDPAHPITMSALRALLEAFPIGIRPDYIMMTRKTRAQLRNSLKTALITDPPTPTDVDDVPIVATDSISNAELAAYN